MKQHWSILCASILRPTQFDKSWVIHAAVFLRLLEEIIVKEYETL